MAGIRMLLARWRGDRGLLAVLVLVVALTAGLVGAVPRLLDRLATSSLAAALDEATPDRAGLTASLVTGVATSDAAAALRRLDTTGDELTGDLDPSLARVLEAPTPVVESIRYDLGALPGEQLQGGVARKLAVRVQPAADDGVVLVEGVLPDGVVETVDLDLGATDEQGRPVATTVTVHQFVASERTAAALDLEVGDRRLARPDGEGPVLRRVPVPVSVPVVLELSGIVELTPAEDPRWFGNRSLHRAAQFDTNSSTTIFGTGLVPTDAVAELPGGDRSQVAAVEVRWPLDRTALLASDVDDVRREVLALRTQLALRLEEPSFRSGLDRLLTREAARRATAVEVLGLAAVSVLGVAAALLVAIVTVLALRRRDATALVRGRGASRWQLVGAAGVEMGLVVLAGAGAAQAVLSLTLPGARGAWLVPTVGAAALVLLVVGAHRDARRRLGALLAERRRARAARPARHVLEGLLLLLAVVATTGLRRRGISGDEVEPLVVAAPALVAGAVAVVVARVVPAVLRVAEVATRRLRSVSLTVGVSRAARARGSGVVVVLLVLGIGIAGVAAAVHRSLVEGQATAAADAVGADVRVDAPPLGSLRPDWDPPAGVRAVAAVREVTRVSAVTDLGAQQVDLLLVEPDQLATIGLEGAADAIRWDGLGPPPLLVSTELRAAGSPEVGDGLDVALRGGDRIAGEVALVRPRLLGRDGEGEDPFVVVDVRAARAVTDAGGAVTARLVATDDPATVRAAALDADPDAEVLVREEVERSLRTAPLAAGVRIGFAVAAGASVVATVVAMLMALTAAAPGRRRQGAVLAAVGTSPGRVRGAVLAEVLPTVAAAALAGVGLAVGLAVLLADHLDLAPFTGAAEQATLALPPWWLAALLVVGACAVGTGGALATLGRVDAGALLREGDG